MDDPDAPEDLRVESFVIVPIFAYTDADGDDVAAAAVWSESRRHCVKLGILVQGLDRLRRVTD